MECVSWDDYFMGIAIMAGLRSKDENTKVGACIVSKDNRILSTGFNGAPRKMKDSIVPKTNKIDEVGWLNTKYPYICHSELNAILNFRGSLSEFDGARIYVTLFPCNECAKSMAQSGITEVIYLDDKHYGEDIYVASRKILDACGIGYRRYKLDRINIEVNNEKV